MNIFFGKISQKVDKEQLSGGYYSSDKGSSWFGELQLGDYVYIIGGDKIQFWQAREWGVKNGRESLLFDILNPDLGINVSQLIALKFLLITKSLLVLSSRSARNKAFFKLEMIKDISLTDLSNTLFYKNPELYRTIKIIGQDDIIESSEDIQLIYKDNKLQLVDTDFIENSIKNDFIDNLDKKGKGAKMKDNVLEFFSNAIKKIPATITYKQIGLRSFYDTFFCEYTGKDKYFLVGAFWDTSSPQDQTERFVREGIWFNGYEDKFLDEVNAVPVGSNIAIKAAFVREKSKSVMTIKARGIVTENLQDGQTLKVDWEDDFVPFEVNFGGYMRTIKEVIKSEHIKSIWSPEDTDEEITTTDKNSKETENDMRNFPLNQILYGPPGTGKTFNSINRAIEIINPNFDLTQERNLIKMEFDRLVTENQIAFTTFHQSMSYEDFIEGIKPEEPEKEGDPVIYRVKYGILRNHCIEASFEIAQLREDDITEEVLDFSILYDKFVEGIEEKLIEGKIVELEIKTGGKVLVESISQQGNVIIKHHDGNRTYTVSKARLTKLQSAIKDLDDVSNINDEFRSIIGGSNSSAYWSVLNAIRKEKVSVPKNKEKRKYTFEEKKEVVLSLSKSDFKNKNGKPFVLIIDEINRGNVSAIFGELITLIEDDKRLGKDEALEVMLPYSKEKFGVPPNLYIIGTMNTADRSVEALDTALRRRFSFEEMPPNYELKELKYKIFGHNAYDVLQTINKRIEKLLDNDHAIGHSYFLSKDEDKIMVSFYKNIIPLLQEYFFGDYGKIGLVLGKGFVQQKDWDNDDKFFADFDEESASDYEDRNVFKIIDYSKDRIGFADAISKLMNI
nr:AAA family ATPase [uncultured Flavobacterium sp.]